MLTSSGSENSVKLMQYKEKLEDIIFNLNNLGSSHLYDVLFTKRNVTELIWSGYYDKLLEPQYKTLNLEILPADMFALFYGVSIFLSKKNNISLYFGICIQN